MSLHRLPSSTIKLIGSSQAISSVSAAVKELVENSLDAGAQSIDVRLENYGMDKIEVRDDGFGISRSDVDLVCKKNCTSKISTFADLDELSSYGFRGEALNALCAVSKLTITTKTEFDSLASTFYFDNDGLVKDSKPSHIKKGTIIIAEGLFRNLPVRRQFLTNGRRKNEEIKRVESAVKSLAIIHPRLRLTLTHNKFLIWQKNSVGNLKQSLSQAIPPTVISQLDSFNFEDENSRVEMNVILPRKGCNLSVACFSNKDDAFYIFINSRRVQHRELEKVLENEMVLYFGHYIPANKFPLCLLSIKLPSDGLDVNLEPNKTKVLVKDLDYLIEKIKSQFIKFYTGLEERVNPMEPVDIKLPKRKLDFIPSNNNVKILKMDNDLVETSELIENIDSVQENTDTVSEIEVTENDHCDNRCFFKNFTEDYRTINTQSNIVSPNVEKSDCFAQALDEVETVLAASTQSSIVVEPDMNNSIDSLLSKSENSLPLKFPENFVDSPKFSFETIQDSRDDNIFEFLTGLPSRDEYSDVLTDLTESPTKNKITIITNNKKVPRPEENEINLENVTLSQWSRGDVLHHENASVTKENNDKKLYENIFPLNNRRWEEPSGQHNLSPIEQGVGTQMGCKNMSAFTKFAKEMRTKIIQQTPGISFTRVASELASKWRDMTDEEKTCYVDTSQLDKRKPQENQRSPEPNLKQQQLTFKNNPFRDPVKGIKKMKYDKVVDVYTSVSDLRRRMSNRISSDIISYRIVSKLSDDLYCFYYDSTFSVLSASRLNEVINYYKNMSTMSVPLKVLENNIPINAQDIGGDNWQTLQCLETSVDLRNNTIVIASELVTKNGFRIEVNEGLDGKQFEITDVPLHVSFYGIEDLKELLQLMSNCGTSSNLINCRPLKIASYIRSETIRRLSSSNNLNLENKGWDSMFNFWFKNVRQIYPTCPHQNPVYKDLFKF